MDFLKLARERYSCRQLSDKKVEKEKLDKIIEAGILAPTATNAQPYKIWLIESTEAKEKLAKANRYQFGAEVFFVVGARDFDSCILKKHLSGLIKPDFFMSNFCFYLNP